MLGNEALEKGFDSLGLRLLAGLPTLASEGDADDELVRQLCEEFGIEVPSQEGLLELYAVVTAEDIIKGAVPAREGCRRLKDLALMGPPKAPTEWIILDEELDLARDGYLGLEEVERNIVMAAKRLIATRPETQITH